MIRFEALRKQDMGKILEWRNQNLEAWRTPHALTMRDQIRWFRNVVSCAEPSTYWGVYYDDRFVGQSELVLHGYNSAEIGLLIDPKQRGKGIGRLAVYETLRIGFEQLGLYTIYGEVYYCNAARSFWEHIWSGMGGYITRLPSRKEWQGQHFDATYFSIDRDEWTRWNLGQ